MNKNLNFHEDQNEITNELGQIVCDTGGPFGGSVFLNNDDARHIVHCVNNYERLVEMLYEAEGHLRTLGYHYSNKVLHEKADKIESLLLELEAEKGGEL